MHLSVLSLWLLVATLVQSAQSFSGDSVLSTVFAKRDRGDASWTFASPRALPNETDDTSNSDCQRQTYVVPSIATRDVFDLKSLGYQPNTIVNQTQITELFVQLVTNSSKFIETYLKGSIQIQQTFSISGILCKPKNNKSASSALQVLVHGIGFDASYWNIQGPGVPEDQYSYVYAAAEQGISTFRYDRLGTGDSEKPIDGVNVVQGQTEVGILLSFLNSIKNSDVIGGQKWNKTLLVGHSYGSAQSNAASLSRPDLIDGLILTGFTTFQEGLGYYVLSANYEQASLIFPERLANATSNYLVTATPYSAQINFNVPAYVTNDAVALVRSTEQPVTQGAFFTLGSLVGPSNFTGPVQVLTSDNDFVFTFRSSNATNIVAETATSLYPQSKNATFYVPKGPGHGLNYHVQAPQIYQEMLSFASANDLA